MLSLRHRLSEKRYTLERQKGLVLLTGMIFLFIASIACFATLENIRNLTKNDGDRLEGYKDFYHLESQLLLLENSLYKKSISVETLSDFLASEHIINNENASIITNMQALWSINASKVQHTGDLVYMIEFLGYKHLQIQDEQEGSPEVQTCIFRITVKSGSDAQHTLQSWVQLFPQESIQLLVNHQLKTNPKRIAWYEYLPGE